MSTLQFKPFIWCEEEGAEGIYAELIAEMFLRINREYTVTCFPWKRALYDVKNGNTDGLFAAFKTNERETFAYYLDTPIRKGQYAVFVKKGEEFIFDNVSNLYGKSVGIASGHSVSEEFDNAVLAGYIWAKENKSIEQNLKKLLVGRIDAYVNDRVVGLHAIKAMGLLEDISVLPNPVSKVNPSYILISQESDLANKNELVRQLDTALSNMWEDGTVDNIYAKYTSD